MPRPLGRGEGHSMFATLVYEKKDGIAWVTLNRPETLNAVNLQMRDELWEAAPRPARGPGGGGGHLQGGRRARLLRRRRRQRVRDGALGGRSAAGAARARRLGLHAGHREAAHRRHPRLRPGRRHRAEHVLRPAHRRRGRTHRPARGDAGLHPIGRGHTAHAAHHPAGGGHGPHPIRRLRSTRRRRCASAWCTASSLATASTPRRRRWPAV